MDPKKSSYSGGVLTISISADGEYRFDESSSHTLRCDGKERPIGSNRTQSCVKSGVTALDITVKEDAIKKWFTHDEVAADGKAFATTTTEIRPAGPVVTSQLFFSRLSGGIGLAGRWQDASYLRQHEDMILKLDNQTLQIDYPIVGQHVDAALSGVDSPLRGPHVLDNATLAARPFGLREFLTVTKHQGKLFSQGSWKLSGDGKVITDTWWNPARPDDKGTIVYDKR